MKIAALDVGLKRIGVALCLDGKTVLPQEAILRKGREQAAKEVRAFLDAWEVDKVVVGIPKSGSSEEEMSRRIRHFVGLLGLDKDRVIFVDEAGSSEEAKALMQGVVRQRRDGRIDSLAAKIILERYLEAC